MRSSASKSSPRQRKPLREQFLAGYWRVLVFGLVGALVSLSIALVMTPKYASSARLIIRTGDTSYSSTDSNTDLGSTINFGGIDLTKQQTLGNTLVDLSLSQQSANDIVKRIGVKKINGGVAPEPGIKDKILDFFKTGPRHPVSAAEDAADQVRGSLDSVVLDNSWVMEITAWDADPAKAKLIADTAATVAVDQSAERFRENTIRELDYLTKQSAAARDNVAQKARAVADFRSANNITDPADTAGNPLSGLGSTSPNSLDQLSVTLAGQRASSQALLERLSKLPKTITTTSVVNGVPVQNSGPNPAYTDVNNQLQALQTQIAATEAQFNLVASRLGGGSAPAINATQSELTSLQADLDNARASYSTINERYALVAASVDKPRYDATRLGAATLPTTPGKPLRYLFLILGALIGGLGGLLLTWFRSIREDREDGEDRGQRHVEVNADETTPEVPEPTYIDLTTPAAPYVPTEPYQAPVEPYTPDPYVAEPQRVDEPVPVGADGYAEAQTATATGSWVADGLAQAAWADGEPTEVQPAPWTADWQVTESPVDVPVDQESYVEAEIVDRDESVDADAAPASPSVAPGHFDTSPWSATNGSPWNGN